jgi:dTDP-4-amino-4,6-dideoxygalactose transaminase
MSGLEEKYVAEAFASNWIAPLGPNVDAFEGVLSQYLHGHHIAALGTGTAAIHMAMVLLGVSQGDEVIAQDFTFTGTVNPIIYQGATPVFVDSELQTWNMDPELLEVAILDRIKNHKKPKAIIFVDIYGMPANIDAIIQIGLKYEIPVIEDAAEALGSKYKGRRCGTYGEIGTLSFNGNKIITTSSGGALVSKNAGYADQARFLASQAKENTLHFEHHQLGYNYRLSNVLAGIGRGQMEVIEERVEAHRHNYRRYCELLSEIPGLIFQTEPDDDYFSNFWLTSLIVNEPDERFNSQTIIKYLGSENIDSRPLMKPMHMQQVFKHFPAYLNGHSEYLFNNGLCLPSGSALTLREIERIAGGIKFVRGLR